jgi:hypothetical protein
MKPMETLSKNQQKRAVRRENARLRREHPVSCEVFKALLMAVNGEYLVRVNPQGIEPDGSIRFNSGGRAYRLLVQEES